MLLRVLVVRRQFCNIIYIIIITEIGKSYDRLCREKRDDGRIPTSNFATMDDTILCVRRIWPLILLERLFLCNLGFETRKYYSGSLFDGCIHFSLTGLVLVFFISLSSFTLPELATINKSHTSMKFLSAFVLILASAPCAQSFVSLPVQNAHGISKTTSTQRFVATDPVKPALFVDETRASVSKYYGQELTKSEDLKTNACCTGGAPPNYIQEAINNIHPEVVARYYGCGLCLPQYPLEGANILDLGSGSGRDVYIASQLVGKTGKVR